MTPRTLWDAVLASLREQLGERVWSTWLQGSTVSYLKGDELVVRVRDHYAVDWCDHRLRTAIDRTVADIARYEGIAPRRCRFIC